MACKYSRLLSVEAQAQSSASISPFLTRSCWPVYRDTLACFSLYPGPCLAVSVFPELIESEGWLITPRSSKKTERLDVAGVLRCPSGAVGNLAAAAAFVGNGDETTFISH